MSTVAATAGKSVYALEPVVADGGPIVFAPSVRSFSQTHVAVIAWSACRSTVTLATRITRGDCESVGLPWSHFNSIQPVAWAWREAFSSFNLRAGYGTGSRR